MNRYILTGVTLSGVVSLMIIIPMTSVSAQERTASIIERLEIREDYVTERLEQLISRFQERTDSGNHNDSDDHNDDTNHSGHHGMIEAGEPKPTIDLVVHEDPKSGYNIQVVTTNYTFAPEHASTDHNDGEGHAHLYIDGEKITRLYGEWFYIGVLEPGHHTIRVELSANDHRTYTHEGVVIDDTEMIVVE